MDKDRWLFGRLVSGGPEPKGKGPRPYGDWHTQFAQNLLQPILGTLLSKGPGPYGDWHTQFAQNLLQPI